MAGNKRKSSKVKTIVSLSITILFLAYIFVNRHTILGTLKDIRLEFFLLVIVGQILVALFNAAILTTSLKPLGINLGNFEAFKVTTVSSFVNFFTPVVGGASTRAVYLKSKHGLAYSTFISALYANYIIMFLVSFMIGLLGVLVIPGAFKYSVADVLILFFAIGAAGSMFFIVAGHKITGLISKARVKNKFSRRIIKKIGMVEEGWDSIRKDKKTVFLLCVWSVFTILSLILVYWAATKSINISTSFGSYMIFAALASVSLLFNLTPGSIGVRETLYASTYKLTGINAQQVVTFSLVDRAGQLLVAGAAWLIFGNSIVKDLEIKSKD